VRLEGALVAAARLVSQARRAHRCAGIAPAPAASTASPSAPGAALLAARHRQPRRAVALLEDWILD